MPPSGFDKCAKLAQGRWALPALLLLCLLMFVPGIASLPVTDRDEARYAQASRQMAETGDYVDIHFQNEARNKKPVGIYWMQAAAARLTDQVGSGAIWPYRLPSLIGATAAVLLIFALARPAFGATVSFTAAGLLCACILAASEARLAKTDAFLLGTAVAAQLALVRIYLERAAGRLPSSGLAVVFWIAQGLAVLDKGPVIPFISVLTVAALAFSDRKTKWLGSLKCLWGIPLMLLIAAPWFVALALEGNGAAGNFLNESVGHDLLPKLLGGEERHGGWPGTYLLLSPLTFWPGSAVLLPMLILSWRERAKPEVRALFAWLIPAWIVMELIPTKLPHYVLPLYPALALLTARIAIDRTAELAAMLKRWPGKIWLGLWFLLSLALALLGIGASISLHEGKVFTLAVALGAITLALASGVWARSLKGHLPVALMFGVVLAVPFHGFLFAGVAPRLDSIWLSRAAAEMVAAHAGEEGSVVASAGYSEPSLVFMLGTQTLLTNGAGAADALANGDNTFALVESRQEDAFKSETSRLGVEAKSLASVTGLNYTRGQKTTLTLYAKTN